jgi:hypothetical protein
MADEASVIAQRNRVVFPVSDAPKNIVTPGGFSQSVGFFWLRSITYQRAFSFLLKLIPNFAIRQAESGC